MGEVDEGSLVHPYGELMGSARTTDSCPLIVSLNVDQTGHSLVLLMRLSHVRSP